MTQQQFALVSQVMAADKLSRDKAPVMENDPALPLAQQPAMIVHLVHWFARRLPELHS